MAVNFSNTVPAAPAGSTNVLWQTDGTGNISGYLGSAPQAGAALNLTAQTAAITTTTFFTTVIAGVYRLTSYLYITTAGNAVNLTGTFGWTDNTLTTSTVTTANIACNTLGASSTLIGQPGTLTVYADAVSNITYATALSGAIGSGQYALRLRLESLG